MQFHAELEGCSWLAGAIHAHIAGRHTFYRTIIVVKDFGRREAGEYFDAQRFGLLAQPAHHVCK
ncbi:hypothetical protein D3C81_2297570 [compost metagenome]